MTMSTDLSRDEALRSLRDQVATHVALSGEPGYERCTPWNVAAPVTPAAVVLATSPEDVADTVRFAAAHGFTVTVQATGHGAVGIGAGTILVQTSAMKHVAVDALNRTARVSVGARWQDVLDAATPHGLAPLCGSAPGVGVVGYLTPPVGSVRWYGRRGLFGSRAGVRRGHRRRPATARSSRRKRRSVLGFARRQGHARHRHRGRVRTAADRPILRWCGLFDGANVATVLPAWQRWSVGLSCTCAAIPWRRAASAKSQAHIANTASIHRNCARSTGSCSSSLPAMPAWTCRRAPATSPRFIADIVATECAITASSRDCCGAKRSADRSIPGIPR